MIIKELRKRFMKLAHDSMFGEHMPIDKTGDQIQTNFYRLGIQSFITSFY